MILIVSNDFLVELFRQRANKLEIQSSSKMDSDAFSEDSDASGAEVRQINDPDRFINIEVLIMLLFNS